MKLKQRIYVISFVLMALIVTCFVSLASFIANYNRDRASFLKPSLKDFETQQDTDTLAERANMAYEPQAGQVKAPVHLDTSDAALKALRNHLPRVRNALDASNYNSNSNTVKNAPPGIADANNDVRSNILEDPIIQENADTIVEIAHIIEDQFKPKVQNSKQNSRTSKLLTNTGRDQNSSDGVQTTNQLVIPPAFRTFNVVLHEDVVLHKFELPSSIVRMFDKWMARDRIFFAERGPRKSKVTLDAHSVGIMRKKLQHWEKFHNHITQYHLYDPDDPDVQATMRQLATSPLMTYHQDSRGTQLKLLYTLKSDQQALFKPMRYPREQGTLPDHFYFSDFERHYAEIAAFHLDMVMGFYRVPPTVGRRINVTTDVKRHARSQMLKTFFVSPAGNICFHGACDYYCDTGHAVCGHPDVLEGSMQAYLPRSNLFSSRKVGRKTWRHPWRRSYHKRNKAEWEVDNSYCDKVRQTEPYDSGRRLTDLMDMAIFDFLTGNMDRHHYDTFTKFGNESFPLMLDNGRAFGKAHHDELSCLAPVYQCCLVRFSTLRKLIDFHKGPVHLSEALRQSLADDVAQPVLLEPHYTALDRRVKIILKTVYKCIDRYGYDRVVNNDLF